MVVTLGSLFETLKFTLGCFPPAAVGSEIAVVDGSHRDLSNIAGPLTLCKSVSTLCIARQLLQAFPLKNGHIQRPCQNLHFAFGRWWMSSYCLVFSSRISGHMERKGYVSSSWVSAVWQILLQELHRSKPPLFLQFSPFSSEKEKLQPDVIQSISSSWSAHWSFIQGYLGDLLDLLT